MYANGTGIAQDDKQAVIWYRKAAEQKNPEAQENLGFMYSNGRGVAKDHQQASIWYHKSSKQQVANAQASMDKLSERFSCHKRATTKLFGVEIKCATRDVLRIAVKQAGAIIKHKDSGYFADTYHSEKLLKNSDSLILLYTDESPNRFAQAKYTFNSHLDAHQVVEVKEMVVSQYGVPDNATGNLSLGEVIYKWYLSDGIELTVSRGWPDTTTFLVYTYPTHYRIYEDEAERLK